MKCQALLSGISKKKKFKVSAEIFSSMQSVIAFLGQDSFMIL